MAPSPTPPRSPSPQPDNTRWTGAKAATFLKALARSGKVAPAARSVGMSRQAAYRLRARAPRFARLWDMALENARREAAGRRAGRSATHPLLAREPEAQGWADGSAQALAAGTLR